MEKYLLPKPLYLKENNGKFVFNNPIIFAENCDSRVVKAISKLYKQYSQTDVQTNGKISISHGNDSGEAYSLYITEDGIKIDSDSAAGAFYAIQTLKQLLKQGKELSCVEIHDKPEFEHRGFYHDVTRGRIPKIQTLKELVDKLAEYKVNSLQLYMEHTFDFDEYKKFNENQEPYTKEDIIELDEYCKENFIELIPSLSCFGHLYELLQLDEYKHLCELENYEPQNHVWRERMDHHTIDVSNPQSIELIKSLVDRYCECFSSKYFNICCDETFDLGKGRNSGKPVAELYVGFVSQLVKHLEEKGKTVMLWADVVQNHLDEISGLSNDTILLNWNYSARVNISKIKKIFDTGRTQIVCPGTWGWQRMIEYLPESVDNIKRVAAFSKICNVMGIINTNWGDFGHFCNPLNVGYSLALGATESWNPGVCDTEYFDKAILKLHYESSDENVISAVRKASKADEVNTLSRCFAAVNFGGFDLQKEKLTESNINTWIEMHQKAEKIFKDCLNSGNININLAQSHLTAIKGYIVLLKGLNSIVNNKTYTDWEKEFDDWTAAYTNEWTEQNRKDELFNISCFFKTFKQAVLNQ